MQTTSQLSIETVLLELMSAYDEGLAQHGKKTARIAAAIAGTIFGYESEQYATIRIAALGHDIGKISVPRGILSKAGSLTDDEWRSIYHHPIVSGRILSAYGLERAARFARSHHERWNGSGYPDRLAGEEIPLGARIVSVADAFATMTTDLPYQPAQSRFAALAELRRSSGTQFDPEIVETACGVISNWGGRLRVRRNGDRAPQQVNRNTT